MKIRLSIVEQNKDLFIKRVQNKYHFDATNITCLEKVYEDIFFCMSPYAVYKIWQKPTGCSMIDDNQTAMVAISLGEGVDRLQARYDRQEKLLESYTLECITNELLLDAYQEFNTMYEKVHRKYVKRYVFIGEEIPLTAMTDYLQEIQNGSVTGNVTANQFGVLTPSKSVAFFAILTENPKQICEGICMGCHNPDCENRSNSRLQEKNQTLLSSNPKTKIQDELKNNMTYGMQRIFHCN